MPSSEIRDSGPLEVEGRVESAGPAPMVDMQVVDPNFMRMMDIEMIAGVGFDPEMTMSEVPSFSEEITPADYLAAQPRSYVLNQTAMKKLGYSHPEELLGKHVRWSIGGFQLAFGPVIGIMKDYHQESLHHAVDPLVMTIEPLWLSNILIKVETAGLGQTLEDLKSVWNNRYNYALSYSFLDEMFDRLYRSERVQIRILSGLTLLAVFIAVMGLLAMLALSLQSRTKELAIRRIIGANFASLVRLIGSRYLAILVLGTLAAVPFSYWAVRAWLADFAYQIRIDPLVYVWTFAFFLALLVVIVGAQTWSATARNPISKLREEG
ncbi:MAG: FtsX-like permease family protein [Saprospiraceae bacterium]|nr:FtsX-like permease family protein [Saprospiraceae bacterium]